MTEHERLSYDEAVSAVDFVEESDAFERKLLMKFFGDRVDDDFPLDVEAMLDKLSSDELAFLGGLVREWLPSQVKNLSQLDDYIEGKLDT